MQVNPRVMGVVLNAFFPRRLLLLLRKQVRQPLLPAERRRTETGRERVLSPQPPGCMPPCCSALCSANKKGPHGCAPGGICLLILVLLVGFQRGALWHHVADLQNTMQVTMTKDGLRMFCHEPVLGCGLGTFTTVYPQFRSFYTNLFVNAAHDVAQRTVGMKRRARDRGQAARSAIQSESPDVAIGTGGVHVIEGRIGQNR